MEMFEISYQQLAKATGEFFARHWSMEILGSHPTWQRWEAFLSGSVPNYQHPGCYTVFLAVVCATLASARVAAGASIRSMAYLVASWHTSYKATVCVAPLGLSFASGSREQLTSTRSVCQMQGIWRLLSKHT